MRIAPSTLMGMKLSSSSRCFEGSLVYWTKLNVGSFGTIRRWNGGMDKAGNKATF
jgi:hypothetical protein